MEEVISFSYENTYSIYSNENFPKLNRIQKTNTVVLWKKYI